jgi:hypothetical protein
VVVLNKKNTEIRVKDLFVELFLCSFGLNQKNQKFKEKRMPPAVFPANSQQSLQINKGPDYGTINYPHTKPAILKA